MLGQQLIVKVLGDCDQGIIEEFRFYPGEERVLKLQIQDYQNKQKWCIPATSTLTLVLSGTPTDVTIVNANITVDSSDRSIIYTTLTEVNTTAIITGMLTLTIVSSTVTRIAVGEHLLKRIS